MEEFRVKKFTVVNGGKPHPPTPHVPHGKYRGRAAGSSKSLFLISWSVNYVRTPARCPPQDTWGHVAKISKKVQKKGYGLTRAYNFVEPSSPGAEVLVAKATFIETRLK